LSTFTPKDPNFKNRVRENFNLQPMMKTLGVNLEGVEAGKVLFTVQHHNPITQQHGFLHGGGVAAMTVEFKTNFLAPALGETYRFEGSVVKPGRTLVVTEAKAFAIKGGVEKQVAMMTATMMPIRDREDVKPAL